MPYKDPTCERARLSQRKAEKKWRKNNPKYRHNYYCSHSKEEKENVQRYYQEYRTKITKKSRKHYQIHGEKKRESSKEYRKLHPEVQKKCKAKRRNLGFIPLNEPFPNSEAHHIDKMFVVYIPEELHKSISHNVWTGRNMELINDKAFEWLDPSTCSLPF